MHVLSLSLCAEANITFAVDNVNVVESQGYVFVCVRKIGNVAFPVTVALSSTPSSATAGVGKYAYAYSL